MRSPLIKMEMMNGNGLIDRRIFRKPGDKTDRPAASPPERPFPSAVLRRGPRPRPRPSQRRGSAELGPACPAAAGDKALPWAQLRRKQAPSLRLPIFLFSVALAPRAKQIETTVTEIKKDSGAKAEQLNRDSIAMTSPSSSQ